MTDKSLKAIIKRLNQFPPSPLIHIKPLSDNVDFAFLWFKKPMMSSNESIQEPYNCYLIKNESGLYVSIVRDMGQDLHWYVIPQERGKGYLTNAMKNVILIHLFQSKDVQHLSINEHALSTKNFKASAKVALSLGFEKIEGQVYRLKKENYHSNEQIEGKYTGLTKQRLEELRKEINNISYSLKFIQTEIECKLGDTDFDDEVKYVVEEILSLRGKLDKYW